MNVIKATHSWCYPNVLGEKYFKFAALYSQFCTSETIKSRLNKNQHTNETALKVGQPVSTTHPHIVHDGELLPGIPLIEIKARRKALIQNLQKYTQCSVNSNVKEHIVVIPSAIKKFMSDNIPYVFRQNTDFLYLSGCFEPDSILILEVDIRANYKSTIFLRPKDKNAELWDGPRTGAQLAPDVFGVDEAYNIMELKKYLFGYRSRHPLALLWYDEHASNQSEVTKIIRDITNFKSCSPTAFIQKLRLHKSPNEYKLLKKSCDIACIAINQTIAESCPGMSEHQLFAKVDYFARMLGASYLAYPPVVASGTNATTIHYINNNQIIHNNDMVLMDAGCEYNCYSSDITRTWPISGEFTEPQRILYEILYNVQLELVNSIACEGGETLDQLFHTMCHNMGKYLREIGLIPKFTPDAKLALEAFTFCPHHVSHYIGMDVHDTPLISKNLPLTPGIIFTIEPGIYIPNTRRDVPLEYRNIGMRIEDNVYINSKNELEVLTRSCVKNRHEIENLVSSLN